MVTKEQALTANEFHYGTCTHEHVERWRRNGATQTWKRNTLRFRIPVKHGLYVYGNISNENQGHYHTAEDCPLLKAPSRKSRKGANANA